MSKSILILLFFISFVGCHKDVNPAPATTPPTVSPVPTATPPTTEADCIQPNKVWLSEDGLCKDISDFTLPTLISDNTDSIIPLQKIYIQAVYSIAKVFNQLTKVDKMNVMTGIPTKIKEDIIYMDPNTTKANVEAAILEKAVNDSQLECSWEGFANAHLKDLILVRNMFLKQVSKLPILNSVTLGVSGSHLNKSYAISKNNNDYKVDIDPNTVTDSDINNILKQLK